MSDQEPQSTVSSENPEIISNEQSQALNTNKNESNQSEQSATRRITMPQDVRYSTDQNDREKLAKKYDNYEISDTNACNIRFLIDSRQKKNLLGRNEDETSNLHALAKKFNVNMFPGYQHTTKHSYKIFGTETNVQKSLVEIMNRMFKRSNRATKREDNENSTNQQSASTTDKSEETENKEKVDDESTRELKSIFVTTINPDSSVTEEEKSVTATTEKSSETEGSKDKENADDESSTQLTSVVVTTINPDSSVSEEIKSVTATTEKSSEIEGSTDKEKVDDESSTQLTSVIVTKINPDSSVSEEIKPLTPNTTDDNNAEQEKLKFIPLERKPQYTFIMLISSQGQEVLKKNWTFFAGSLQQRLNVIVANPVKLPKFGDKQVQSELSITGESTENLTDATLQIAGFINDVLGVPIQPYQVDEEPTNENTSTYQRPKTNNNNYRSSPSQHQGQPSNNFHERTFFNRNRAETFEQVVLIRSDCVARIVGTRGSNIKRIQTKCHLRDMTVGRQANENGYIECLLFANQIRNLHFAIDMIRSFLHNEDASAVIVIESNHADPSSQESPHPHELAPPNMEHPSAELHRESGFMTQPLHLGKNNAYPQSSYNFQNTPSFDFTHQATSASRKTDKRPGELNDNNNQLRTPNESQNQQYDKSNNVSISPLQKSKRSCPETKEIDCTTEDGFWIQKQHYQALDDQSKELFDSLVEKLEKIRIATEENVARKQQRLVGRNRSNKSRVHTSSISYLNEDNNRNDINTKIEQSTDVNEEKENQQETSSIIVNQN